MDVRIWFFGGPKDGEFVGVAYDTITMQSLLLYVKSTGHNFVSMQGSLIQEPETKPFLIDTFLNNFVPA